MSIHVGGRGLGHFSRSIGQDPTTGYVFYFSPRDGIYRDATGRKPSASAMTGFSYTRTGTVGYDNGNQGYLSFAANNAPIITGVGYKAHGSTTNRTFHSQSLTALGVAPGTATGVSITANAGVAPDGNTTADRLVIGNNPAGSVCGVFTDSPVYTSGFATASIWLKSANGQNQNVGLVIDWNATKNLGVVVTPQWQRFVLDRHYSIEGDSGGTEEFAFGSMRSAYYGNNGDAALDIYAWQGQLIDGNFPDGGPAILTTTAAVAAGASTLAFTVPNGSYSAVYTFDDGSTQTIATTVAAGTYTVPNFPTLNRATVAKITLA